MTWLEVVCFMIDALGNLWSTYPLLTRQLKKQQWVEISRPLALCKKPFLVWKERSSAAADGSACRPQSQATYSCSAFVLRKQVYLFHLRGRAITRTNTYHEYIYLMCYVKSSLVTFFRTKPKFTVLAVHFWCLRLFDLDVSPSELWSC